MSKLLVSLVAVAVVIITGATFVKAEPVEYPYSLYLVDVTPVEDGVQITLAEASWDFCWDSYGAAFLAEVTIYEYVLLSGQDWPFDRRSGESVAVEIQAHCVFALTYVLLDRAFPINIGFDESFWEYLID